MKISRLAFGVAVALRGYSQTAPLEIRIDSEAARAVLAAVGDASLTRDRALTIARLPGNEGLMEKAKSSGLSADENLFADSLLTAARRQHKTSDADIYFGFSNVRDHAPEIRKTLTALLDPSAHAIADIQERIALLSPRSLRGEIDGFLVAGGSSGGFTFGTPKFYLNLGR